MTELTNTPGGVAVEFTASCCGPCRLITSKYEALSNEYETVGFVEADIDKVGSIGKQIRSVPTFIFYSEMSLSARCLVPIKAVLGKKLKRSLNGTLAGSTGLTRIICIQMAQETTMAQYSAHGQDQDSSCSYSPT